MAKGNHSKKIKAIRRMKFHQIQSINKEEYTKNRISEIKNLLEDFNMKFEQAEERIS